MKIMRKQPTIAYGLGTHAIACVFHVFEGFQEMTKIIKRHKTIVCCFLRFWRISKNDENHIAHGFKTHTIACVFHDFEGFQEMTKIMKKRHSIVYKNIFLAPCMSESIGSWNYLRTNL